MVNVLHKSLCIFVLFCIIYPFQLCAKTGDAEKFNTSSAIYFIENKGQITDQNHNHRKDIDFKMPATRGLNLFVGAGHMHYVWSKNLKPAIENEEEPTVSKVAVYRLDVELVGANKNIQPEVLQKGSYYERYYTNEVQGAVAYTYGKVIYKNIYPNIDWVLYTKDGGLKYDFVVRPGGDTKDIKIKYNGAENINLADGALTITTPYGSITEQAPYTYQSYTNAPVVSSYVLEGNTMSFELGAYNGQVVIDPSLEWATYMGGSNQEYSYGIASDIDKNIYIVGRSESQSSNVAPSGVFQDTLTNGFDGFIVKYAPGGARQWGTYYGGNGSDAINSITVNSDNDIIFVGVVDTSYNLFVPNAHQATHGGGNSDVFMGKMNGAGQLSWATYYGGSGSEKNLGFDFQVSVRCDAADNIYLAGVTSSDTGIHTNGTEQTTRGGLLDGFIAKFSKTGIRQWGTYYGGIYDDALNNINADGTGFVYVSGDFKSDGMGTSGTFSQNRISTNNSTINNNRDNDIFIGKFNPNTGKIIWGTYYGGNSTGSGEDVARGIVVADSSNIYVSGSTVNHSGIATNGAQQTTHGDINNSFLVFDALLLKLDSNGVRKWCTYLGGQGVDHGGNVVLDNLGNPNMTARVAGSTNIATVDGYKNAKPGTDFDAAFVIFDKGGNKTYGSYYGNNGTGDYGYGIATAGNGHIYFCGNTESATNIWLSGHQQTYAGSSDAFLAKFTPDTSSFIFQPFTETVHCQGDSFVLNYGVTAPFQSGNNFTVQLSNSSGSFASPVNIGTSSSSSAGTIKVGMPNNVSGTGFRIRIIGTAPIDTSNDNGIDIAIYALPAKPVATNNGPVCSSDTLKLFSTPYNTGFTYSWTGPDNFSTTSTTSADTVRTNMTANAGGDYIITAESNGCMRSDTTTVVIKLAAAKPRLEATTPVCNGDSMVLGANDLTTGSVVVFSGPGGFLDSTGIPISSTQPVFAGRGNMTPGFNGVYELRLYKNGCISVDKDTIVVQPKPAPMTASSNSPICQFETLVISGSSSTTNVKYNIYGNAALVKKNVSLPYSLQNPIPSYTGNVTVEAELNGCTSADTINVVVKEALSQPVISKTLVPKCTDDTFILTATYLDSPCKSWWVRPGGIVDSNNVTIPGPAGTSIIESLMTPAMNGKYYLYGEHPITGCTRSDSVDIFVEPFVPLYVDVAVNPGKELCVGADYKFEVDGDSSIKNYRYIWHQAVNIAPPSPPPGTIIPWQDTSDKPERYNFTSSQTGKYYLKMMSRANECHYARDTFEMKLINSIPDPVLTLPPDVCSGDSLDVYMSHPNLTFFKLYTPTADSFYGKKIVLKDLSKFKHEGRYLLYVSAGGNCEGWDTGYINNVYPTPLKPTITAVKPLCDGETLNLQASSTTPGVTYEWNGPSGYTSSIQNPTIQPASKPIHEGYYKSQALINGCLSKPDSVNVVIYANPAPFVPDVEVCEGAQILLEVTNDTSSIEYNWSSLNGNGFNSGGSKAVLNNAKLSEAGGYVITAREDLTGCIGTDTALVTVVPLPGEMEGSYNNPICSGKDLILNVTDTSTNVSYAWSGPGGFTYSEKEAIRQGIELGQDGIYIVRATRGNCFITDSLLVEIAPSPATPDLANNGPIATGQDLILQVLNPESGASFEWKGPNNYGSRVQDPIISRATADQAGTYTLTTTLNGCTSNGITVVIVRGGEIEKETIVLYPNPNDGIFTVEANLAYDQIMPYEVITASGRVVHRDVVISEDKKIKEQVEIRSVLPSGVYVFRIMMSGESREVPFTIVR